MATSGPNPYLAPTHGGEGEAAAPSLLKRLVAAPVVLVALVFAIALIRGLVQGILEDPWLLATVTIAFVAIIVCWGWAAARLWAGRGRVVWLLLAPGLVIVAMGAALGLLRPALEGEPQGESQHPAEP